MKTLVVYSSQSGNTKKLADAVYESIADEKEILSVEEAPAPENYDFIVLGFWLKAGKPDPKAQEYLPKIGKGKKVSFLRLMVRLLNPNMQKMQWSLQNNSHQMLILPDNSVVREK
jgi:flavodoxin